MAKKRRGRKYKARHMDNFVSNMAGVKRLLDIHTTLTGSGAGRRHNVAVLNKSAVILLVACWEACMEDLVTAAFDIILKNAKDHTVIPSKVRTQASISLRESQDASQVWELAGDGWRVVVRNYRAEILDRYAGKLNTPRPKQIEDMFASMIGLNNLSSCWTWHGMTPEKARERLDGLVTLRGAIAHRVTTVQTVHKAVVTDYSLFVRRLAALTHNHVLRFVAKQIGFEPWHEYQHN